LKFFVWIKNKHSLENAYEKLHQLVRKFSSDEEFSDAFFRKGTYLSTKLLILNANTSFRLAKITHKVTCFSFHHLFKGLLYRCTTSTKKSLRQKRRLSEELEICEKLFHFSSLYFSRSLANKEKVYILSLAFGVNTIRYSDLELRLMALAFCALRRWSGGDAAPPECTAALLLETERRHIYLDQKRSPHVPAGISPSLSFALSPFFPQITTR